MDSLPPNLCMDADVRAFYTFYIVVVLTSVRVLNSEILSIKW